MLYLRDSDIVFSLSVTSSKIRNYECVCVFHVWPLMSHSLRQSLFFVVVGYSKIFIISSCSFHSKLVVSQGPSMAQIFNSGYRKK